MKLRGRHVVNPQEGVEEGNGWGGQNHKITNMQKFSRIKIMIKFEYKIEINANKLAGSL